MFDEWFEKFWAMYDKKYTDNCSPKKGSKTKAKRAAQNALKRALRSKQMATEQEFCEMCTRELDSQKRYWDDAKRLKKWMPNFPHVSTWFNDERFSMELDSHAELREKPAKAYHREKPEMSRGTVVDHETVNEYRERARRLARGLK